MSAADTNALVDVYVRDIQANVTQLVTVGSAGSAVGVALKHQRRRLPHRLPEHRQPVAPPSSGEQSTSAIAASRRPP